MGESLQSEMTVEEVLTQWPETAVVFNDYNMACIGCMIAPFCTIKDAASDYGITAETLLLRLNQAIHHSEKKPPQIP